jgi:hypothetical protein
MSVTTGIALIDGEKWNDVYYNDDLTTGNNDGTSEANAWQSLADVTSGAVNGDRINFKKTASPVTLAANFTFPSGFGDGAIWCRGYETTIGDGGKWEGDSSSFRFFLDTGPAIVSDMDIVGSYSVSTSGTLGTNSSDVSLLFNVDLESDDDAAAIQCDRLVAVACTFVNTHPFGFTGSWAGIQRGKFIGCTFKSDGDTFFGTAASGECQQFIGCTFESTSSEARSCLHLDQVLSASRASVSILENSMYGGDEGLFLDTQLANTVAGLLVAYNAVRS